MKVMNSQCPGSHLLSGRTELMVCQYLLLLKMDHPGSDLSGPSDQYGLTKS